MDGFDQNDNQTSMGSGGNSGAGATGAGSVFDAFKGAGQPTHGGTQESAGGQSEPGSGSTQAQQAHAELKAWGAQLSKELKENKDAVKALAKFEDISGLASSYLELEKKLGTMAAIPGEKADKEELESFYRKLGKPEAAQKYTFKQESEAEKSFAQAAFDAHLSDAQAKAMYDFVVKAGEGQQQQYKELLKRQAQESDALLKKEYGNLFEAKMGNYTNALKLFGNDEVFKYMEETGVAYNPSFVRMFVKIGEALTESRTALGGSTGGQTGVKEVSKGGTFSFF